MEKNSKEKNSNKTQFDEQLKKVNSVKKCLNLLIKIKKIQKKKDKSEF